MSGAARELRVAVLIVAGLLLLATCAMEVRFTALEGGRSESISEASEAR